MLADYPVYVKWSKVLEYLLDLCGKYPQNVRFNIAHRISNLALDVMEDIVEVIYTKEKKNYLISINLKIEKLRVLLQVSTNNRYISIKQFGYVSSIVNETGSMIGGWLKKCDV